MRRRQGVRAISVLAVIAVVGLFTGGQAVATQGNDDQITFCHRTDSVTNPYRVITTDPASIIKRGHDGHEGLVFDGTKDETKWGDIIPAFDYPKVGKHPAGHFDGLNLPGGQSWLDRMCAPAETLPVKAQLTLVKKVVNIGGGDAHATDWMLKAEGPEKTLSGKTEKSGAVPPGSYTLSEFGGPDGYTASPWSCTNKVVTADVVTLAAGDSVTCTITNTFSESAESAHLTLVKIVENTGGGDADAEDWRLRAEGPTMSLSGKGGKSGTVPPGSYSLSESGGPDGYNASPWSCTNKVVTAGVVTLAAGDSVTCTITNTFVQNPRKAQLTLVKVVVNAGGGTAALEDWTLTATGSTTLSGKSGTSGSLAAGSYTLTESGPTGYTASPWSCIDNAQTAVASVERMVASNTVRLAAGDSVTCTITNTFRIPDLPRQPQLTLVKIVVNTGGGTAVLADWTLTATGSTTLSGKSGTSGSLAAGSYTLTESGPTGYSASAWSCTNKVVTASVVTLLAGDSVTCTITNTFQPAHLTLVKSVVNGHGGTATPADWTLSAVGPVTITGASGSGAVTAAAVPAGGFVLAESGDLEGYTASAWACVGGTLNGSTVTLAAAESATCTITNTEDAPAVVDEVPVEDEVVEVAGVGAVAPVVTRNVPSLAFTGVEGMVPMSLFGLLALALGTAMTAAARRGARE